MFGARNLLRGTGRRTRRRTASVGQACGVDRRARLYRSETGQGCCGGLECEANFQPSRGGGCTRGGGARCHSDSVTGPSSGGTKRPNPSPPRLPGPRALSSRAEFLSLPKHEHQGGCGGVVCCRAGRTKDVRPGEQWLASIRPPFCGSTIVVLPAKSIHPDAQSGCRTISSSGSRWRSLAP